MEGRALLSTGLLIALSNPNSLPPHDTLVAAATGGTGGGSHGSGGGTGTGANPSSAPPAPVVPGQGVPTPQERARESFRAVFTGPYQIGPGRFSDQARIISFRGVGGSNQFRHGDYEMAIVTPTDPTAPTLGASVMNDKSTNSGGVLGLDLTADPQAVDRFGRPTRLSFTNDPNIYSGIYFFNTSSGTVTISYSPPGPGGPHGYRTGVATAVFRGQVYTSGLTNPLANSDLYARGGRLHHR